MLDTIVKARVGNRKGEAPPKLLYMRELVAALPPVLYEQLEILVRVPCLAKLVGSRLLQHRSARRTHSSECSSLLNSLP
jgi:hypothetical protein